MSDVFPTWKIGIFQCQCEFSGYVQLEKPRATYGKFTSIEGWKIPRFSHPAWALYLDRLQAQMVVRLVAPERHERAGCYSNAPEVSGNLTGGLLHSLKLTARHWKSVVFFSFQGGASGFFNLGYLGFVIYAIFHENSITIWWNLTNHRSVTIWQTHAKPANQFGSYLWIYNVQYF